MLERHWPRTLRDYGVEGTDLLAHAGLSPGLFSEGDVRLTQDAYFRLWRSFEGFVDEPAFPVLLGRQVEYVPFDPLVFAWISCRNIEEGLHRMARFYPVRGPMRLVVTGLEDGVRAEIAGLKDNPPGSLIATELVTVTHLARMATRFTFAPRRVVSHVAVPDPTMFEIYFGVPVEEGEVSGIEFDREDAARPFLTAGHPMWRKFDPGLRPRLSELRSGTEMGPKVRSIIAAGLAAGRDTVEEVAEVLSLPVRSVHRKLRSEGSQFREELLAVRQGFARHYLEKTELRMDEIANLLNFSGSAGFVRAFTGWTGLSPEAVRAQAQAGDRIEDGGE